MLWRWLRLVLQNKLNQPCLTDAQGDHHRQLDVPDTSSDSAQVTAAYGADILSDELPELEAVAEEAADTSGPADSYQEGEGPGSAEAWPSYEAMVCTVEPSPLQPDQESATRAPAGVEPKAVAAETIVLTGAATAVHEERGVRQSVPRVRR